MTLTMIKQNTSVAFVSSLSTSSLATRQTGLSLSSSRAQNLGSYYSKPNEPTWATDSKSLIDALSGEISKAGDHTQLVWRAIERHLIKSTEISAVWVPAHCGIPENLQADKLANAR